LQGHAIAFFVLSPDFFKSWEKVLLFKIVNLVTKLLVLGETIRNGRIIQFLVQLPVIPQYLLLLVIGV
jgi:coenzyme F420-reducing hydrogenase alpha subunit